MTTRPAPLHLVLHVAAGVVAGLAYAWLDGVLDGRLVVGANPAAVARAHALVDVVLPVVIGALVGATMHLLAKRARAIGAERARAEAFRSRLEKLQRDQAVWVMVASVLHELQNPLHALGLLLDELAAPGAPADPALAERAHAQMDRVVAHLRTLRALPATEGPEREALALRALAQDVAHDLAPIAAARHVQVRVEGADVTALADPTYVRVILESLVQNGVQANAHAAGARHVAIELARDDGGRALVRVVDDGPGVPAALRPRLFEPLRTTKPDGLGLGLPIARALARAMDGDLALEDADGSGASFRLVLPSAEAA